MTLVKRARVQVRVRPYRHAGATKLTMTASKQSDADGEKAPIMKTWCSGDADGDGRPCTFARLRTGRCESTAVFGEGAETEVVVDGDVLQVTLTVTGLEEMAELVNRDVLSVELAAKDLPENRE